MPRRWHPLLLLALVAAFAAPAAGAPPPVTTLHVGDEFVVTGQTGSLLGHPRRATGTIVVRGSWNGGPWHVITTTRTDATGHYRFVIRPRRHGRLTVRIFPPDKQIRRLELRVV
jgi:hypothetical protein